MYPVMNAAAVASPCPQCGRGVPADAPEGLCPRCVAEVNLAEWLEPHAVGAPAHDAGMSEVSALFPQLEIHSRLGRGGMGVVYKARQPRLNRWVALKVLAAEREGDPRFAERFTREAQALARLRHPGIVAIHEFGEVRERFYLVMEHVEGESLRARLGKGRFTAEAAAGVVAQVCEALQGAHEQGVVHRDIKPENLLLDAEGRVRIADFGIAKLLGSAAPRQVLTEARGPVGTPHYMAPEQVERPTEVDHRADLFSVGVVLYELLTGELPLGRFPPPSSRGAGNAALDAVVLRALEKDPDRRFPTAGALAKAVAAAVTAPAPADPDAGSGAETGARSGGSSAGALRWMGPAFRVLAWFNLVLIGAFLAAAVVLVALERRGVDLGAPWMEWVARWQAEANGGVRSGLLIGMAGAAAGSWLMALGARALARRESYRLALAACALALVIPPGCAVGWPLGWWGLVVLGRRTTQAEFRRGSMPTRDPQRMPGARFARAAALVLLPLVVALAASEWMARPEGAPSRVAAEAVEPSSGAARVEPPLAEAVPPVVVATVPAAGEAGVDFRMREMRVTFSKPMRSTLGVRAEARAADPREEVAPPRLLGDERTFLLPVRLEPGRTYLIWINADGAPEFADREGRPAVPYLVTFETRGNTVLPVSP